MSINTNKLACEAVKQGRSPFLLLKEKLGYEDSVKGFYCCENCQNLLATRKGTFCRMLGYDPSDPDAQITSGGKCRSHRPGRLTTLEEGT